MSLSEPSGNDGPVPGGLQFQNAEVVQQVDPANACSACKQSIGDQYYQAQGFNVCEACADRIQSGQQAPPPLSLLRATLYGAGASLVGCIIYATVAIITGYEIGLIAILIGAMVGKAVRKGSNGRGGRPQQILAVLLTYFAITTSYIPVAIHNQMNAPKQSQTAESNSDDSTPNSIGAAVGMLLLLVAIAPFLSLSSGVGAAISLFIIFIGLQRAWKVTGRTDLLIMGPYDSQPAQ